MQIFIAGDSTASIKEINKRPETGWGEKLHLFLKQDVNIVNAAKNGRSTKSFLDEGRLDVIERQFNKGDYLIIQFGHNDEKIDNPERYASPVDYQQNLKTFINAARKKGVTPIILSSVSRRIFMNDNKTIANDAIGIYPALAKELSIEENVLFVDMFKVSKNLYEYLGYKNSKSLFLQIEKNEHINYPNGIIDNTHFNDLGGYIIASLIVEELYKLNTNLKKYVLVEKILTKEEIINIVKKGTKL